MELSRAQQSVIDLLGRGADPVPLPDGLIDELETELVDGLADIAVDLDPADPLFVSKHALSSVHSCEAHYVVGDGEFEWSVPAVRGTVAHRAIEVMIHYRGDPHPGDLVDESIARIVDEDFGAGRFVGGLREFDLAELRSFAVDKVAAFQETFPPLKAAWSPRTESRSRVELFDGRIVLSGKTDLTLGRPPRKVIIDLKSGRASQTHREDLRFYALLEALKLRQAPRKLASYYLDEARTHPEDVTEGVLRAAALRTVDGVRKIAELTRLGREPRQRPGPQCRWCPLQTTCESARLSTSRDDADVLDL